jgi:hypothetical protein
VGLLISPKDVDQEAVKSALERRAPSRRESDNSQRAELVLGAPMEVFTLPAVGLQNRNYFSFAGSFVKSLFAAKKIFRQRRPAAVLAMGGFTSAPPVWAGKDFGAKTFLHESNTIPGRANRLLARYVDEAFVGFPSAAARLRARKVTTTGTPVRAGFVAAGVPPAVEPGILPGGMAVLRHSSGRSGRQPYHPRSWAILSSSERASWRCSNWTRPCNSRNRLVTNSRLSGVRAFSRSRSVNIVC